MGETWICLDPDKIEKIQNNFYSIGGDVMGMGAEFIFAAYQIIYTLNELIKLAFFLTGTLVFIKILRRR